MTDLHPFPESATAGSATDTRRFRAETIDAAVAAAAAELGPRVRVVEANRIRRGGLGGFFATDLGVEVTVVVDPPNEVDGTATTTDASVRRPTAGPRRGGSFDLTESAGFVPDPRGRPLGDALTPHEVPAVAPDRRRDDSFVDEVLALTDGGMESLLREIQVAATDEHTDSFAAQLEHWDDRLDDAALDDADFIAQMGGPVANTDDDATFAEQMLASARADLARQVERLQEAGRRRPAQDVVEPSPERTADAAAEAARTAATEQLEAARAAAEAQAAEAERVALARATAERAIAERAEFERLAAERAAARQRAVELAEADAVEAAEAVLASDATTEMVRPVDPTDGIDLDDLDDDLDVDLDMDDIEPVPMVQREMPHVAAVAADRDHALMALDEMLRQVGVDMSNAGTGADIAATVAAPIAAPPVDAVVEPIVPAPVAATAAVNFAAGSTAVDHDPLRRPTELAAAATDQLVSRLAAVVAADGSCLQDLHRVRVAVTTTDGIVIEMTAEMGGAS